MAAWLHGWEMSMGGWEMSEGSCAFPDLRHPFFICNVSTNPLANRFLPKVSVLCRLNQNFRNGLQSN